MKLLFLCEYEECYLCFTNSFICVTRWGLDSDQQGSIKPSGNGKRENYSYACSEASGLFMHIIVVVF